MGTRASKEDDFEPAFASLVRQKVDALVVGTAPFFTSRREQIVALASRYAVPAIYEWQEFAEAGGLVSYGTSLTSLYREVGTYVGKVLKGRLNQRSCQSNNRAAKALGLTVPPTLLAAADKVIE